MYRLLLTRILFIVLGFTLPVFSDLVSELKNIRDDAKFALNTIQNHIIKSNAKLTTSLERVENKLNDFDRKIIDIEEKTSLLVTNNTSQQCFNEIENITRNVEQILTNVGDIKNISNNEEKDMKILTQKQLDKTISVHDKVEEMLGKVVHIDSMLTDNILSHEETQELKLNELQERVNNQHQQIFGHLEKNKESMEDLLDKANNFEKQELKSIVQNIIKVIQDSQDNQNKKLDQLTLKINAIETDQTTTHDLNRQSSKEIYNIRTDLSNIKNKINTAKISYENGQKQIFDKFSVEIIDIKKEISNNGNVNIETTKTIGTILQKVENLENKIRNMDTTLTNAIRNLGQSLQNSLYTLKEKVGIIEQDSPKNELIQISKTVDYIRRVACKPLQMWCDQEYL